MKRSVKQNLCFLLCMVLLLSMLPMTVFGETVTDPGRILNDAYNLASGENLPYTATLTGKIIKINSPYSPQYKNITVTIEVPGYADKPMYCYRIKGEGADKLTVGDTITVTGTITNYRGNSIQFAAGSTIDNIVSSGPAIVVPSDPKQIIDAAFALGDGEYLPYEATLTGIITKVNSPYDETYKSITVTILPAGDDRAIECYRLKGDGADLLIPGDVITVTGTIKNHYGKVEFDTGCTFVKNSVTVPMPEDPKQIVDEAYALADNATLPYKVVLTGTITEIVDAYSEDYKNITVKITVAGRESKPIICYRMKGTGADTLKVGAIITVSGSIKNYVKVDHDTGEKLPGVVEFDSGCTFVPYTAAAPSDPTAIVDEAYALNAGKILPYVATLTGKITKLGGTTATIVIAGREDKKIECTEMVGDGIDTLKVDDIIRVKGTLTKTEKTNDKTGKTTVTVGFQAGCELIAINPPALPTTPAEIVDAAYALADGETLEGTYSLTGEIISVDTPFDSNYGNVTVSIVVEGKTDKPIVCFRLAGEGADALAIGDTITVSGSLTNYMGKIEFAQGCTLDSVIKGENEAPQAPSDPKQIVDEAYALGDNEYLPYKAVLTGTITEIIGPYTDTYRDITVKITVEGREDKPIDCYRLKGEGADTLMVGDKITVSGSIKNFVMTDPETGEKLPGVVEFDTGCSLVAINPRTLTIEAPASWAELYLYTWGTAEEFGTFPGAKVQKSGDQYKVTIRKSLVNLIISGKLYTGQHQQTADIALETNKDVWIQIREDATYTVSYREPMEALDFRVVGDAFWLGNWDVTSTLGSMNQVSENVYQVRFPGVVPGEYAFKIARDGSWNHVWDDNGSNYSIHATRDCAVTVTFTYAPETGEGTAQVTYTPKYKGDITGDKKLNVADVSKVYAHARRTALITDALLLAAGDFTGDGKINVADTSKMYSYLRGNDQSALLETAYQLQQDQVIPKDVNLTGTVVRIPEPYHATSGSVTVSIVLEGMENEPVLCSRLTGEDTQRIGIGSRITVKGTLQNFYGSVEFIEGCQLVELENDSGLDESQMAIVDEAYALGENQKMNRQVTLTGQVLSIRLETYGSAAFATASIAVPGRESQPITCYRMVGNAITQITTGDTITVTGTLQNFYGSIEFEAGCQLISRTSGGSSVIVETDPLKIVDMAYALQENTQMDYDVTLTGRVTKVEDAYSSEFQNITVSMVVVGRESKPIKCYRMKGTGVDQVAVNDTITVKGRIKNYNGNIMFDTGCELIKCTSGGGVAIKPQTDPAAIMAAAKQLAKGEELAYDVTLSGKVLSVNEAYDSLYQNVTVTIAVSGTNNESLVCYRMKGDGVEAVAAGDTITLTGRIKNHYGTIELVYGEMTARTSGGSAPVHPVNPVEIVDEAYALQNGATLAYTAELTGTIVSLKSPFDAQYQHMTVIIAVAGREDKPIECYRMKGDSIGNHLCVGDTITVSGKIRNYNGSVEFDSGCKMISRTPGSASVPGDPKQIVDAAFALGENQVLPYFATLTGVVKSIDEPYTDQYKNVTLTMSVRGTNGSYDIVVYRMKGNGADSVAAGNTITVTGAIKRFVRDTDEGVHEDKVEFDSGCVLDAIP